MTLLELVVQLLERFEVLDESLQLFDFLPVYGASAEPERRLAGMRTSLRFRLRSVSCSSMSSAPSASSSCAFRSSICDSARSSSTILLSNSAAERSRSGLHSKQGWTRSTHLAGQTSGPAPSQDRQSCACSHSPTRTLGREGCMNRKSALTTSVSVGRLTA